MVYAGFVSFLGLGVQEMSCSNCLASTVRFVKQRSCDPLGWGVGKIEQVLCKSPIRLIRLCLIFCRRSLATFLRAYISQGVQGLNDQYSAPTMTAISYIGTENPHHIGTWTLKV